MKLYTLSAVENLMNKYLELGGTVDILDEGSLVYGLVICQAEGKKLAVIKEVYLNEWSSAQTIRFYNKLPKKYEKLLVN